MKQTGRTGINQKNKNLFWGRLKQISLQMRDPFAHQPHFFMGRVLAFSDFHQGPALFLYKGGEMDKRNWRRTIVVDDPYLLLLTCIFVDDTRLVVKDGRGGITFKSNPVCKKGERKWKKN